MRIYRDLLVLTFVSLLVACASVHSTSSLQAMVAELIDQTTVSEKLERRAFRELELLGESAVPYMIGSLGDSRMLAERSISLTNRESQTFEERRQYVPVTVHDALSAILNQVTGESFVFVYNGATPQERNENRNKWIEWCLVRYPERSSICKGG